MSDGASDLKRVTVETFDPRFAFTVAVPAEWGQVALPKDAVDFSEEGVCQPVAVFAAPYGLVILTFSVRPATAGSTVAEWVGKLSVPGEMELTEIGPARAGSIDGIGALGTQQSQAGPMTFRMVVFEQGGWAHMLLGMAPSAVWGSLGPTFDRMFDSFAMANPQPSTVPLWPPDDEPEGLQAQGDAGALAPAGQGELGAGDLAAASQAAERFLNAVQQDDEPTARALLTNPDDKSVSFHAMADGALGFELGEPQADGGNVVIEALLRACPPGESEPQEQPFPLVLRQIDGQWRVDMDASISRMLGFDVGEAMTDMAEGLGNAMAEGLGNLMEGLGEGLKGAFKDLSPPDDQTPEAENQEEGTGSV